MCDASAPVGVKFGYVAQSPYSVRVKYHIFEK